MELPNEFVRHTRDLYGAAGDAWLASLPERIAGYAQRWSLTVAPSPFRLTYNYVTTAVAAGGNEVVLKIGVPNPELSTEAAALRHYAGNGAVRLLDEDVDGGALLLERLRPGTMLATLADDEQATAIAAALMLSLWRPPAPGNLFGDVTQWGAGLRRLRQTFDGGTGPFDRTLVEIAETVFADAAGRSDEYVLLHGDLHHENILSAERGPWLAIDPKGIAGPRGYEVGTFLRNYLFAKPDPASTLIRRVDCFHEILGLDRCEILRWGVAHNVLSAWWSYEESGGGGTDALNTAALCVKRLHICACAGGSGRRRK